jgi:hypothetical protein
MSVYLIFPWSNDCNKWQVTGEPQDGRCNNAEEPQFLSKKRLGGLQYRSRRFGEKKNILPLRGFEPRLINRVALSLYRH